MVRVLPLLDRVADATPFPDVQPDQKRLADQILLGHESPSAAVLAVVPVVAHDEVVAGLDLESAIESIHLIAGQQLFARGDEGDEVECLHHDVIERRGESTTPSSRPPLLPSGRGRSGEGEVGGGEGVVERRCASEK